MANNDNKLTASEQKMSPFMGSTGTISESDDKAYSSAMPSCSVMMPGVEKEANDKQSKYFGKIPKMEKHINRLSKQLLLASLLLLLFGVLLVAIEMGHFYTKFGKSNAGEITSYGNNNTKQLNLSIVLESSAAEKSTPGPEKITTKKPENCLANFGNVTWNREDGASDSAAVFVDALTVINIEGSYHTNIRTREPFSMLDAVLDAHRCRPIFYFELLIQKNKEHIDFGLSGPGFRLSDGHNWVGKQADSYGIDSFGTLSKSGTEHNGYGEKFGEGDIVGCGLILLVEGRQLRRQLFFTKNGRIYGEPIWLPKDVSSSLYPTVGLAGTKSVMTAVEANFGANLLMKPFRYEWTTHDTGNSNRNK